MCYVATHPEKLDESRADQWRKVCPSSLFRPALHQHGSAPVPSPTWVPVFERDQAVHSKQQQFQLRVMQRYCPAEAPLRRNFLDLASGVSRVLLQHQQDG